MIRPTEYTHLEVLDRETKLVERIPLDDPRADVSVQCVAATRGMKPAYVWEILLQGREWVTPLRIHWLTKE